ncbi:MAG TPA: hypothetical protein VGQ84_00780 [Gaiellaceae bacterium]|nr:hypothetical protein [Gaiellaceae bacterium]
MGKLLVAVLVALAFPASAWAGPCGLPDSTTTWVDYGATQLHDVFVQPGTVLGVSTGSYPQRVRDEGAATIYWDLHLRNRVGTPTAPADPAGIEEKANRLFVFAASQTACPTPWIVLNELFGAHLETPWSANNAQYRTNVLTLVRELARRGARPMLLISRPPYTGSADAAAWWREIAKVSDILPEVFFSAPTLWRDGPIAANRRLRIAFRQAVGSLTGIGIPVTRIGITLGFQVAPNTGGREGLRPASAWLETVKWQALAAQQVAIEMKIASVVSWGWGTWDARSTDPDKPRAACVYLWARNPNLCDGPAVAGRGFNNSRREGQLILPGSAQCRVGGSTIPMSAIARLNRFTGDRNIAFSALYRRVVEGRRFRANPRAVLAAEQAIVRGRFGGSRSAYGAALARAGATVKDARAVIGDQLRRREVANHLPVAWPSPGAVATFYNSYPDVPVRPVRVGRPPWWLGGQKRGLAIAAFAPPQLFTIPSGRWLTLHEEKGPYSIQVSGDVQELGAVPLAVARRSIAAGLHGAAQDDAAISWSSRQQQLAYRATTCRRDQLPLVSSVELSDFAPFLSVRG